MHLKIVEERTQFQMTLEPIQEQTPTIEKKKKIRQKVSRVIGGLFTPLVQTSKPTLQNLFS